MSDYDRPAAVTLGQWRALERTYQSLERDWQERGRRIFELERENERYKAEIGDWADKHAKLREAHDRTIAEMQAKLEKGHARHG
jgi:predicted RNase H-like nuclease (RuvC/YqgF family)